MTTRDLRRLQNRYETAAMNAENARVERDNAIRALASQGHSHAEIFRVLGGAITRSRIGQIAQEK